MIGGASAGKEVGKRPIWKNPKLYYWGVPAFVVPEGIGIWYGVYRHRGKNKMKVKKVVEEVDLLRESVGDVDLSEKTTEEVKSEEHADYYDVISEKLSKKVVGIKAKYLGRLKGEEWGKYFEFDAVGGVFDLDQFQIGRGRKEYVRSLKDNADGTRRFDVCRLTLTEDDHNNLYIFRVECNEEDDDKVGYSILDCKEDNYKKETKYLRVRLAFGDVDYFVRYDSKKPIESYAHAISNAVFFWELQKNFKIGYYGFTSDSDVYNAVLYEGVEYVEKYSPEIEKKYKVKYEDVKDDINELYANCEILEEYYCEMLKAREEILVK